MKSDKQTSKQAEAETMEEKRVAIVLPVFNLQKYIKESLESLLAQTYHCFTVFAVDDGSTDGSSEILDEYAEKDSRIRVIHKINGGVSSARNAGLSAVEANKDKFEYLLFFDGDDLLEPEFLQKLVKAMNGSGADVASFSVKEFSKTKEKVRPIPPAKILDRDGFAKLFFEMDDTKNTSVSFRGIGNKFYRVCDYTLGRYDESIRTREDQDWILRHLIPNINKAVIVPDAFVLYRMRKSSITRTTAGNQNFDTLANVLGDQSYPLSARKGIQRRFLETAYNKLKYSFAATDSDKQNALIKESRDLLFRKFEFPLTFQEKKRLLFAWLPKPLLARYFKKSLKGRVTNQESLQEDYFD